MDAMNSVAAVAAGRQPGFIVPSTPLPELAPSTSAAGVQGASFGALVTDGMHKVNDQLAATQTDLQELATGQVQNLHQIMIRMEESRVSFQLMLQVRNRLLEAYQDVMKMSV